MNRRAAGRGATARQRAQEEVRMRRLHGYRIKKGLDELGELDAQASQQQQLQQPTTSAAPATETATSSGKRPRETGSTAAQGTCKPRASSDTHGSVFGADWTTWRRAKDVLFSTTATPAAKQAMLDAMQLWHDRARKARPLPPYVEATELLLQCIVLDERRSVANHFLAQSYGAALSRAVHVMTGSFATQQASTYRGRARTIGFPEEAVEVRQRVAHGALPALSELRWVCGLVLQFLFERYWLVQEQHVIAMEREQRAARESSDSSTTLITAAAAKKKKQSAALLTTTTPAKLSVEEIKDLLRSLGDDEDDVEDEENEGGEGKTHDVGATRKAGDAEGDEAKTKTAKSPSAATSAIAGWTLQ